MKKVVDYDFSGYATKNDLKCSDGRIIRKDAFKDSDGVKVPLVWKHLHDSVDNILGHAILENRDDGVYAYCKFNDTPSGKTAKSLVEHGDINALSIFANQLTEKSKQVFHGLIREVSLVLSGANPGALIDNLSISHEDGSETVIEDEAIITTGLNISLFGKNDDKDDDQKSKGKDIKHANGSSSSDDKTVQEVLDTFNDEQKTVMYALIAEAVDAAEGGDNNGNVNHSDEGDKKLMKKNVFDKKDRSDDEKPTLTHDEFIEIVEEAKKCGSFKEAFLAHAVTYGIENIDLLFPDAKTLTDKPAFVQRRMEWVGTVLNGTYHTPFSRIKSLSADITLDTARAKGYVKGALKKEEFFALSRRITTPGTIYKKQKLDRDDIIDITEMDVVIWLKGEMRMLLDEELARAILVSDGREPENEDKISETNIRPIWKDDDFFSDKVQFTKDQTTLAIIDQIITSRENYNGSGNPVLYTTTAFLNSMLLLRDSTGQRLYRSIAELETELRVSKIIEVPVMSGLTRQTGAGPTLKTWSLKGIVVNLKDYSLGADKGGQVSMFDDFDIDYNQYKYLIETRCSGALVLPKSAQVLEQEVDNPPVG